VADAAEDKRMKRTLITGLPEDTPRELRRLGENARVFDSSCSPEARVYYIERDGGYYLKKAPKGTLAREAELTRYFHSKGLGTEVLDYRSEDADWFLTARMTGEDCTHERYLANPLRLSALLGEELRRLHEVDFAGCPVPDRNASYLALAFENERTGNYDRSHFPDSFGYRSAEEAKRVLLAGMGGFRREVLLHGDYCLPNVMLSDWRLSGFIDLGNGGVGDRHIDLFWGVWTLEFNLHTNEYRNRFLDAYGRDRVEEEMLRVVAAAEVFG